GVRTISRRSLCDRWHTVFTTPRFIFSARFLDSLLGTWRIRYARKLVIGQKSLRARARCWLRSPVFRSLASREPCRAFSTWGIGTCRHRYFGTRPNSEFVACERGHLHASLQVFGVATAINDGRGLFATSFVRRGSKEQNGS